MRQNGTTVLLMAGAIAQLTGSAMGAGVTNGGFRNGLSGWTPVTAEQQIWIGDTITTVEVLETASPNFPATQRAVAHVRASAFALGGEGCPPQIPEDGGIPTQTIFGFSDASAAITQVVDSIDATTLTMDVAAEMKVSSIIFAETWADSSVVVTRVASPDDSGPPVSIEVPLAQSLYFFGVECDATGESSSLPFTTLSINLAQAGFAPGDTIRITIEARATVEGILPRMLGHSDVDVWVDNVRLGGS